MRTCLVMLVGVVFAADSFAAIRYVSVNSANPTPPYTNWATAANVIQDAVDVAETGDEIVVTNGIYVTGGRAHAGTGTNRVVVDKPLLLRSFNGPRLTEIHGYQVPGTILGEGAVRCAYLANGARLSGFTLTKGASQVHAGGVWCEPSAVISNCVIVGNSAAWDGGGVREGTLYNCALIGNSANTGGGVSDNFAGDGRVTLFNCTVVGNSAITRGGVAQGLMYNCLVYFNNALFVPNSGTVNDIMNDSCTTPLPSVGVGNIDLDPRLVDGWHLGSDSPCRGAGNAAYASGVDIDGEPWASPPSIGCDEYLPGGLPGPLSVSLVVNYTNVAAGFTVGFSARIEGISTMSVWDFGDGVFVTNGPHSGQLSISHAWAGPGDYLPTLRAYNQSYPMGVSATQLVHVITPPVHYVSPNNPTPIPPYTSWTTAAKSIQDAIDAASPIPGTWVLVTNGVYATGGRAVYGTMTNRVVVHKPLVVQSVNGPAVTVIRGYQVPGSVLGTNAIRCVYLTNGASISGFTLTNGATQTVQILFENPVAMGGGIWCEAGVVVSNCVVTDNVAFLKAGGVYGGTLYDCTLSGNRVTAASYAHGGGAYSSTLYSCSLIGNTSVFFGGGAASCSLTKCTLMSNSAAGGGGGASGSYLDKCALRDNFADFGGGAEASELINCTLSGNSATSGGGAAHSSLNNCALTSNSATLDGGGANGSTLNNCTLTGNTAVRWGGGTYFGGLNNSVVYHNTAAFEGANYYGTTLNYCCTTPFPGGLGNLTNAPRFNGTTSRLLGNSPCINAGRNAYAPDSPDLDGKPRIVGGTVDMGAYEFQTPSSVLSYAWAQKYGLPTNGSADYTDPDGEGMNNWQEWQADTVPTNALSALRLMTPFSSASGVTLSWESANTRRYWLERASGFAAQPAFSIIVSNLPGQPGSMSFTDTNTIGNGQFFYRVGVQP